MTRLFILPRTRNTNIKITAYFLIYIYDLIYILLEIIMDRRKLFVVCKSLQMYLTRLKLLGIKLILRYLKTIFIFRRSIYNSICSRL